MAIIVLVVISTVIVLAYMYKHASINNNVFVPAEISCSVSETYNASTGVKSSIKIQNTSNTSAFVRCRLVSYWVDADGNVVGKPSTMPTINYDSTKWIKASGSDTYYFKAPVDAGELTPNDLLTSSITLQNSTYSLGYSSIAVHQVVEVLAEAIQANPSSAVSQTWGATVGANGKITAIA